MSDKPLEGAREQPDVSIIGGPGVRWANKDGKVYFQMKRIDYQQEGNIYYIFSMDREAMDDERRAHFDRLWPFILEGAKRAGVPFYDIAEIGERGSEAVKGLKPWEGQRDFDLQLYDHASGEIHTVTKGITIGKKIE